MPYLLYMAGITPEMKMFMAYMTGSTPEIKMFTALFHSSSSSLSLKIIGASSALHLFYFVYGQDVS
jgi:hypothetical protein